MIFVLQKRSHSSGYAVCTRAEQQVYREGWCSSWAPRSQRKALCAETNGHPISCHTLQRKALCAENAAPSWSTNLRDKLVALHVCILHSLMNVNAFAKQKSCRPEVLFSG